MFFNMFQALFTADNYSVETCHMPREYTIIIIYITYVLILLGKTLKMKQIYRRFWAKYFINYKNK